MDSRQSVSRATSSIQQAPYSSNISSGYGMPYQAQQPHLPPIQHHQSYQQTNHNFLPQVYQRPELPRYQSAPGPLHAADRYNTPSHMGPQSSIGGQPPPTLLPQPGHQYSQPQNYTPTSSASVGYPTRIAPAPPRSTELTPLSTNFGPTDGRNQMWTSAEAMPSLPAESPRDDTRTHVVGSQGRRGILPSAPGRAAVAPENANGSPRNTAIPTKDADGKFPCPNCNKTYLHAKHLKRHMLRHTGDRPYMCVLCRDTFSRSDILKRHFQKCSVRRGNPTGLSHLSSPAAHLKKSQAANAKAGADQGSTASTPTTANIVNGGFPSTALGVGSAPGGGAHFSEAPSMSYNMPTATAGNMQRPTSDQSFAPTSQSNVGSNANGSWSMHNAKPNPMLFHSNPASPDQFGLPANNTDDKRSVMANSHQQSGEEWMFQPGTHDGYMNPIFSTNMGPGYEHAHNGVKKEYDHHEGNTNEFYIPSTSLGADGTLGPPIWNLDMSEDGPLQFKVNRLVDFCFPGGIQESLQDQQNNLQTRALLTVDNVKHFLELFTNFQGHFPCLHMPTFDLIESNDGLILAIICIGAVYSHYVLEGQVRNLMQRTKYGIERTSSIFCNSASGMDLRRGTPSDMELQELQALLMLSVQFIWHGGSVERASMRAEIIRLFSFARRYGMLELAGPGNEAYSYLHNIADGKAIDPSQWSWDTWIQQEKRLRIMYLVFLTDAALNIWFNCAPQLDPSDIKLPLPCDDAAWDATDQEDCARALGLRGREAQAAINITGSLRLKQMAMHHAMSILYNTSYVTLPRTTNAYSKFILIHALHTQIWQIQRQRCLSSSAPQSPASHSTSSPGAPLPLNSPLRAIAGALGRWKRMWDDDMQLQYPPVSNGDCVSRRVGFCRDGVYFYWLTRAFLQPNRVRDWQLPADKRFKQVISGLGQVREWSKTEGARRGEEPGSICDIDMQYGPEPLELDMTKLLQPLIQLHSNSPSVHDRGGGQYIAMKRQGTFDTLLTQVLAV